MPSIFQLPLAGGLTLRWDLRITIPRLFMYRPMQAAYRQPQVAACGLACCLDLLFSLDSMADALSVGLNQLAHVGGNADCVARH
jgi:hypothetical protein